MFGALKKIFSRSGMAKSGVQPPVVEFVDFEDGLLAVRSSGVLASETQVVQLETAYGWVVAEVRIASFDTSSQLYRMTLLNHETVLAELRLERRLYPRIKKMVRVLCKDFPGYMGMTENLSVQGACISVQGEIPQLYDIEVKIELDDPSIPPLVAYADVAWSGQKPDGSFHCGIRFLGLDPQVARDLARYVERRLGSEKALLNHEG